MIHTGCIRITGCDGYIQVWTKFSKIKQTKQKYKMTLLVRNQFVVKKKNLLATKILVAKTNKIVMVTKCIVAKAEKTFGYKIFGSQNNSKTAMATTYISS